MSDRKRRPDYPGRNGTSNGDELVKKPRSTPNGDAEKEALLLKIRQRKEALAKRLQEAKLVKSSSQSKVINIQHTAITNAGDATNSGGSGAGLNVPLHPLLRDLGTSQTRSTSSGSSTPSTSSEAKHNKYLDLSPESQGPNAVSSNDANKTNNPYLDIRAPSRARRARRGLVFNAKGKYIEEAEKMRKEAQLAALKKKIEEKNKVAGLETDMLAGERNYKPDVPPAMEWWDQQIMVGDHTSYDTDELNIGDENSPISIYIQHPVPITAPWEKNQSRETHIHLTKKEYKRIRKNNRTEKHKETQDRIRLGLDPAPPPKIKLSNVMTIYTNEAVKDPTMLEQRAKEAVEERREKHDADNESRKLTADQQYERFAAKLEREKEKGLHTAVFRVENFTDGRHKYLVNYNANKFQLTGMVIINSKFTLIVVEGGYLAIKKFTRLLMVRMKWTENAPPRDTNEPATPPADLSNNKCTLVWSGQLKANKFMKWTLRDAETEQDAKEMLARNGADNYWVEARALN